MNKKLFEDVKIEYIHFEDYDIICTSFTGDEDSEISTDPNPGW